MKKVTASDVAKLAGVSQATVSFVLNSRVDISISETTRKKVLDAAKKLNYIPGTFSPSKNRPKSKTIGLLIPNLSNPFYPKLVGLIENYAAKYGYSIILCNTNRRISEESFYLRKLYDSGVDAVIFGLTPRDHAYVNTFADKLPIVIIGETDDRYKIPSFEMNSIMCGQMMAEHLIELGHKKIGFISTPIDNITFGRKKRLLGVRKTIAAHDDCELVVKIDNQENEIYDGAYELEVGYKLATELVKDKDITAIIAANDIIACGVLQSLADAGISVPQDISVCGFDNVNLSEIVRPKITTIDYMLSHRCMVAMLTIIDMIEYNENCEIKAECKPQLIIRESTAPPRKK